MLHHFHRVRSHSNVLSHHEWDGSPDSAAALCSATHLILAWVNASWEFSVAFHRWQSRFTGTKWHEQQCSCMTLLCGGGWSDPALEGWLANWVNLGCHVVVLELALVDWELSPGTLVLIIQYSHINNQNCRITWQGAERNLEHLLFQVRLIWTQCESFQVIWKNLALKRASLSDNFPLGNETQKGIKRKLIMSVCWINQSCYLNLKKCSRNIWSEIAYTNWWRQSWANFANAQWELCKNS